MEEVKKKRGRPRKPKYKNSGKTWTKEDDDILLEKYGLIDLDKIAKRLGRHPMSCRKRYFDLTGSTSISFATGLLTAPELSEVLGVDRKTINNWVKKHDLKHTEVIGKRGFFGRLDFWRWAENNQHRINFDKYQEGILSPEPKWVQEKLREKSGVKKGNWTMDEIEVLKFMVDSGRTVKEVAERLNRTIGSVKWKKHEIYVKGA